MTKPEVQALIDAALRAERLRIAEACELAAEVSSVNKHGSVALWRLAAELRREPEAPKITRTVRRPIELSDSDEAPVPRSHCGNKHTSCRGHDADCRCPCDKCRDAPAAKVRRADVGNYTQVMSDARSVVTPPALAPMPRGCCGRCSWCGGGMIAADANAIGHCRPGVCNAPSPRPDRRTHCAGCGAPYQEETKP